MAANLNESFQVLQDLLNKSTSSVYSFDQSYIKNLQSFRSSKVMSPCVVGNSKKHNINVNHEYDQQSQRENSLSQFTPPSTPLQQSFQTNNDADYDEESNNQYVKENVTTLNELRSSSYNPSQRNHDDDHLNISGFQQQNIEHNTYEGADESEELDKEMLIELVRRYLCIWDMKSKAYKD